LAIQKGPVPAARLAVADQQQQQIFSFFCPELAATTLFGLLMASRPATVSATSAGLMVQTGGVAMLAL
jgi:hypothetical protein